MDHETSSLDRQSANLSSDIYDTLAYNLFQAVIEMKSNSIVLAFTSVNSGEGVTSVVAALFRSVQLNSRINSTSVDMQWLKSQSGTPRRPGDTNLDQAAVPSDWAKGWEQRRAITDGLRAAYQAVAIDCPALSASSDVLTLARLVDGVVLIVEAERTRGADIRSAEQRIEAAGGHILGSILNQRRSVRIR